jgi:crossover junction endodeoxyribonuclease RuvC
LESKKDRIILGIDPGTTIMGFGLIKVVEKKMFFLQLNELILKKYDDHYLRLKYIFERTIELIDKYNPDEIAIEAPFFWEKCSVNVKAWKSARCCNGSWSIKRDINNRVLS